VAAGSLGFPLEEYRDIRGFYFGVRSVLYRMCKPSEDGETVYTQLREIRTQKKGDGLFIDYRPLRVQNVSRITYTANTTSALLKPLHNPVQKGDEQLGGFFDRDFLNLILPVMEDVVSRLKSGEGDFQSQEVKCPGGIKSVLKRAEDKEKGKVTLCYRCYLRERSGKEIPSEEIKFFIG